MKNSLPQQLPKTLEAFLESECGMAPPSLVEYYEDRREFIEEMLSDMDEDCWDVRADQIWLMIPDLPDWWHMNDNACPLCGRALGNIWDRHHLVPKSKKGSDTVDIHRICHNTIHSTFTEKELAEYYHTIDRLLENETIRKFVRWVRKKDPDFYDSTKDTKDRKRKRRR
jgi:hypothetical protein